MDKRVWSITGLVLLAVASLRGALNRRWRSMP
jgi:hypothetical protein